MRILLCPLIALLLTLPAQAQYADSTGLPGDGFSLDGALELFKNAKNLESFEQSLNKEENKVNNLDLDSNGETDYIRVVDHMEGSAHAIVMQVALSATEHQDVAVVELEKNGEASAILQIRGAEELYGADVLVEPFDEVDSGVQPTKGPSAPELLRVRVTMNVWAWPCVGWVYSPAYAAWRSPWYWGYYPPYWHPWRPISWRAWHGWHRPYRIRYRPAPTCTVVAAHAVYRPRAVYAPRIRVTTAPVRAQRAAMHTPAPEHRGTPAPRTNEHSQDRRLPASRHKGVRTPEAQPTERKSRTQPKQPARTAPITETTKAPAQGRGPKLIENKKRR